MTERRASIWTGTGKGPTEAVVWDGVVELMFLGLMGEYQLVGIQLEKTRWFRQLRSPRNVEIRGWP